MATKLDNNQIQSDYEDRFNKTAGSLKSAEQDAYDNAFNDMTSGDNYAKDADASSENDAIERLRNREDEGSWMTKMDSFADQKGFNKPQSKINAIVKKGGPVGALMGLLLGGAGMISFFGAPGMLIVNFAEVLTQKLNDQHSSFDRRTTRVIRAKIENSTKGVCTSNVSIKCKYSSMSDKQVEKFRKAGIEIAGEDKSITGRRKPTSFKFNGKEISAKDFSKEMRQNQAFRVAVNNAYAPKFMGMSDKIFNKVASRFKTSKKAPFDEKMTDEDREKKVSEITKEGQQSGSGRRVQEGDKKDPTCPQDCATYTKAEADDINSAANQIDNLSGDAEEVAKENLKKAGGNTLSKAASVIKVTGILDDACTVVGMANAVAVGAKTIRAAQLVRYAMVFLSVASMIKAGDATPEDVAYLGTILTAVYAFSDGSRSKSATEGIGFRSAAYGDKGATDISTQFLAGGGLGGKFSNVMDNIYSIFPGGRKTVRTTCRINNNPFVQAGSFVAGLALWIVPGGQAIQGSKLAAQGVLALVTTAATIVLPGLIADLIAGVVVDKTTVGEAAGDALASGTGSMLSNVSMAGGNLALTPAAAVAYQRDTRATIARDAEIDRATHSPFDATNSNTFMGSIYTAFMPTMMRMGTTTGIITSAFSLASPGSIVGRLTSPNVTAADTSQYESCQDLDYRELNLATDPFCNVKSGLFGRGTDDDPNDVIDRLAADIDPETGEPSSEEYKSFVEECFERTRPLGASADDSGDTGRGEECILNTSDNDPAAQRKRDFSIHYIDQRVNDIMENGLPNPGEQQAGSTTGQTVTNGNYALPLDIKWYEEHPDWFSKPHHDYPAADIPVPEGTNVYAMSSGKVTAAPNGYGYGQGVSIMGDDGVLYNYGHGQDGGQIVKVGDTIKAGQLIMHSGNTGRSTGPHLHVDMKIGSEKACPQNLLVALGKKESSLPSPQSLPTSGCSN